MRQRPWHRGTEATALKVLGVAEESTTEEAELGRKRIAEDRRRSPDSEDGGSIACGPSVPHLSALSVVGTLGLKGELFLGGRTRGPKSRMATVWHGM